MDSQRLAPAALPPGNTRYPWYKGLCGPQRRSGRMRKISPPPGFDPRTVQSVASRYTDCAMAAHSNRTCSVLSHTHVTLTPHITKNFSHAKIWLRQSRSEKDQPLLSTLAAKRHVLSPGSATTVHLVCGHVM